MKKRRNNKNGNNKSTKDNKIYNRSESSTEGNYFQQEAKMTSNTNSSSNSNTKQKKSSDTCNYALLLLLYTIQGVPLGLSASIPFLIQQRLAASGAASYNSQAIFSFATWPFSLKLLWAPIVDALYIKRIGRRKTWLCPIQFIAGCVLLFGSDDIERQLIGNNENEEFHVQGITIYFFTLYFLMATQDIAVDGWALTMLSKENRGKGPVCNSIGQNIGYFISFVGFLALNDVDSSENLWRPLFRMESAPGVPLVTLSSFMKFMGIFIISITIIVALFKTEVEDIHDKKDKDYSYTPIHNEKEDLDHDNNSNNVDGCGDDEPAELDASEIGILETYQRLWAVCRLPSVRSLFLILLTYRFPTALSDNVKFLKAVEYGLSKQTTALLSPAIMLPLAIAVPIVAAKLWHGHPLTQFLTAYKLRVTLVPIFDIMMLLSIKSFRDKKLLFWVSIVMSTSLQAIMNSLQFNAQMTFFASRVDPAIGGSYMTLLNTAANLGGTWPSSIVMYLMGRMSTSGNDGYFSLQFILSLLGLIWIYLLGSKVIQIAKLPETAWRTTYFKKWALEHNHSIGASVRNLLQRTVSSFVERGGKTSTTNSENTKVI